MPYDVTLTERVRQYFSGRDNVEEKKMFGGLAFMLDGNMCVGINDHRLMARVGPAQYRSVLQNMHATIMDFTGKPLTGFVYVEPEAVATEKGLCQWIELCEHFVKSLPPKE